MRGNLETIVGAMFAGKTSELLKRILWAKHQNKKIIVIKPSIDDRYSNEKIITHNDLSHECYAMNDWETTLKKFVFIKGKVDMVFLDEIQFMDTSDTLLNIEIILNRGIDVVCAGLDQDSRGKPWETSSMLLGLSDKIVKNCVQIIFREKINKINTIISKFFFRSERKKYYSTRTMIF